MDEATFDKIETGLMELNAKVEWLMAYIEHLEGIIGDLAGSTGHGDHLINLAKILATDETGGALTPPKDI